MQPDGSYKRVQPEDGKQELLAQFDLMKKYQLASEV
jgi:hypothetical protein